MERRLLRTAAVSLVVSAVIYQVHCGSSSLRTVTNVKILGFAWKNCGKPNDPAVLKTLAVTPDPVQIPGNLKASASGSTSVELSSPLPLNVTLEKEVAGFWVKVPCLDEMGSCHYKNLCDLLNLVFPPGQNCPEPLHTYGLPCRCPFKAGSYSLPESSFYLPTMDLPYWLTNGNYRVQGVLGSRDAELGCLQVCVSLHSS